METTVIAGALVAALLFAAAFALSLAWLLRAKEKAFAAAVETLREQFGNIALSQMKVQGEGLAKANRASLDGLLAPVRDQVKVLQELAEKAQREAHALGVGMAKDALDIGNAARGLRDVATALSSDTRFQGRKGEEILAEKLRQSGLEENVSFFLQRGIDTDRPDAQVRDTENRWLVIDSKVSLTAYMEYAAATDEAVRSEKLAQHVASVRQKIDQLARKKYPKVFAEENRDRDYLPVTAMFVPYEAPLAEALKAEPSLWQRAAEGNVVLVTPLALMAYLRLVYLAWQHEKEARGQREIVDAARELLARMNAFLSAFEDVGRALESLSGTYDRAKGVLVDAPHAQTIANSARRLLGLHVRLEGRKGRKLERAECLKGPDAPGA
jgi:DNA recombination protein RmuC